MLPITGISELIGTVVTHKLVLAYGIVNAGVHLVQAGS
jgi:hypothetical protein